MRFLARSMLVAGLLIPVSTFAVPLFAALLLLPGCASSRRAPAATAASALNTEVLWQRYEQAVEAAKVPRPEHVSTRLVPILTFTPGLVWDEGRQKVLMAT
jgi:hypothetical protein